MIDRDFDFVKFLDYLHKSGMNLTRIYPGGMFEAPDKYIPGNPLGPLPGRQILPWANSGVPGAHASLAEAGKTSFKYDLNRWNSGYFDRLKRFVSLAAERDIIVEIVFFNGMYADCWPLMAMYHGNNIQGVGRYEAENCGFYTTTDPRNADVIPFQQAYIAKITEELNGYDNLIFDLCDEPSLEVRPDGSIFVMPDVVVAPWLLKMKEAFLNAEARLSKKHLLGQTVQNLSADFSSEAWCEWLPAEYVKPAQNAIDCDYHAGKPLVIVESDYFGFGLTTPYTAEQVRLEGWWFMLQGGAGVINLNGEFFRGQETGGIQTRTLIVPQRKILRDFMEGFDLRGLSRYTGFSGTCSDAVASMVAEPGRQYGLYLFRGGYDGQWGAHFVSHPGIYQDTLTVNDVSGGSYRLEWLNPSDGSLINSDILDWPGGNLKLHTPAFTTDIAMRMQRQ